MPSIDTGLQFCPRCAAEHPRASCRTTRLGNETALLCPTCGMVTRASHAPAVRAPLREVYAGALRYPFQRDAWIALVALAIGVWVAGFVFLIGPLVAGGLVLTYVFQIVRHTAAGNDDLPSAADFTDWSDLLRPMTRFGLAVMVALGPAVGAAVALDGPARVLALLVAAVWCVGYLPGAVAVASFQEGCLGGVNPLPVIELARRVPGDYALTVATLAALAVPAIVVRIATALAAPRIPVVSAVFNIAGLAVSLAVPFVMARVIGLLLRERRDDIGFEG